MALSDAARTLLRRYPDDEASLALSQHLGKERPRTNGRGARVLIQGVEDPYYLGVFGKIANALRARADVEVDLYVPASLNVAIGADWRSFALRTFPLRRLKTDPWVRLYAPLVDRVGYRSATLGHPIGDDLDAIASARIWRSLGDVETLGAVTIDGVLVGDLVIDSYLRFRPSPRVVLDDPFLLYVLWQAHRDVRRARAYFRAARPRLYLGSYSTYVQHGVVARVALDEGVAVHTFGNMQRFGKQLTTEDVFHTMDPRPYREGFGSLDRKAERLGEAARQLEFRLSGGIDTATSYMARSAYAGGTVDAPDVRGAAVVFLHDFYDSPHVYADLVFPDFWAWICCTIETLEAARVPYFVKPHPNQIGLSEGVLAELRARYPRLPMLPIAVTNRQLADGGMACAITMYGTVAHEVAYLGVPSIGCARHPHAAFDFCRTAKSQEEYVALLGEAARLPRDEGKLREEALAFYCMHNLALGDDERALRDAMIALWKLCGRPHRTPREVIAQVDALAGEPGFRSFVEGLAGALSAVERS